MTLLHRQRKKERGKTEVKLSFWYWINVVEQKRWMFYPLSSDKSPGALPALSDGIGSADFKDQASPQEET